MMVFGPLQFGMDERRAIELREWVQNEIARAYGSIREYRRHIMGEYRETLCSLDQERKHPYHIAEIGIYRTLCGREVKYSFGTRLPKRCIRDDYMEPVYCIQCVSAWNKMQETETTNE